MHGASLVPPLIGLFGVIVGALLAALFALHRERLARRQQRQVEALHELQDACLAHRQAWQAFADAQAVGVPAEVARETDRTGQRLDLLDARVLCPVVRERAATWRSLAKLALLQDDRRPVSVEAENNAWLDVHTAVAEELTWLG